MSEHRELWRHRHPGSGARRTRPAPKGRQVEPEALDEVRGDWPDAGR